MKPTKNSSRSSIPIRANKARRSNRKKGLSIQEQLKRFSELGGSRANLSNADFHKIRLGDPDALSHVMNNRRNKNPPDTAYMNTDQDSEDPEKKIAELTENETKENRRRQRAIQKLTENITQRDLEKCLQSQFLAADVDKSGTLDKIYVIYSQSILQELGWCLAAAGLHLSKNEIDIIVADVDVDVDGLIDIEEFMPLFFNILVEKTLNELPDSDEDPEVGQIHSEIQEIKKITNRPSEDKNQTNNKIRETVSGSYFSNEGNNTTTFHDSRESHSLETSGGNVVSNSVENINAQSISETFESKIKLLVDPKNDVSPTTGINDDNDEHVKQFDACKRKVFQKQQLILRSKQSLRFQNCVRKLLLSDLIFCLRKLNKLMHKIAKSAFIQIAEIDSQSILKLKKSLVDVSSSEHRSVFKECENEIVAAWELHKILAEVKNEMTTVNSTLLRLPLSINGNIGNKLLPEFDFQQILHFDVESVLQNIKKIKSTLIYIETQTILLKKRLIGLKGVVENSIRSERIRLRPVVLFSNFLKRNGYTVFDFVVRIEVKDSTHVSFKEMSNCVKSFLQEEVENYSIKLLFDAFGKNVTLRKICKTLQIIGAQVVSLQTDEKSITAASRIQRIFKVRKARRDFQKIYSQTKEKLAAVVLQVMYHNWRTKYRIKNRLMRRCATQIQSLYRGIASRGRVSGLRLDNIVQNLRKQKRINSQAFESDRYDNIVIRPVKKKFTMNNDIEALDIPYRFIDDRAETPWNVREHRKRQNRIFEEHLPPWQRSMEKVVPAVVSRLYNHRDRGMPAEWHVIQAINLKKWAHNKKNVENISRIDRVSLFGVKEKEIGRAARTRLVNMWKRKSIKKYSDMKRYGKVVRRNLDTKPFQNAYKLKRAPCLNKQQKNRSSDNATKVTKESRRSFERSRKKRLENLIDL